MTNHGIADRLLDSMGTKIFVRSPVASHLGRDSHRSVRLSRTSHLSSNRVQIRVVNSATGDVLDYGRGRQTKGDRGGWQWAIARSDAGGSAR